MQNSPAIHAVWLGASLVEVVWGLVCAANLGRIAERLARWSTRTRHPASIASDVAGIRRLGLGLAAIGVVTALLTAFGILG